MRKGLIILGDLKDEDLIWLSRNGELRQVPANQAIITAGQDVHDLFFITDGHFSVRIGDTTVAELAEEMSELTRPNEAAERVKKTLYSLFESQYSWDFDHLKKENLGKATQKLSNFTEALTTPWGGSPSLDMGKKRSRNSEV